MAEKSDPTQAASAQDVQTARDIALGLLARREHSALEMHHKLSRRGFEADIIAEVLADLQASDWLSDERFAEIYAHARADRGYGPLRIRQELRERGVDDATVAAVLGTLSDFWQTKLAQVQHKRFRHAPQNLKDRAQQLRFLRHRGYTLEQINLFFRETDT